MSIFDVLKDRDSKKEFEASNEKAIKMFTAQKAAIQAIRDTEGYSEIKKFWEREKEAALQRIITGKSLDENARSMFALADSFLKFLETRER